MPIGTSDGEQYKSSMDYTMALGAPEKAAGELNTPTRYLPSQFPPAPDPNQFYKPPAGSMLKGGAQLMSGSKDSFQGTDERALGLEIMQDEVNKRNEAMQPTGDFRRQMHEQQELEINRHYPKERKASLDPNVVSVLSQPHIANAIANPKIDRSHDVPYEAGASNKPDDFTTHIDKHIPSEVTISGKTFDPAIPANIHEQVEREVMQNLIKKGMSNEKAYEIAHHEYAEPAEDAWYRHNGIDIAEVNKWWAKQDKTTEAEGKPPKGEVPPDLYKKPYPHGKVEGVKHEPSNVNQVWAMNDNNPKPPANDNMIQGDRTRELDKINQLIKEFQNIMSGGGGITPIQPK